MANSKTPIEQDLTDLHNLLTEAEDAYNQSPAQPWDDFVKHHYRALATIAKVLHKLAPEEPAPPDVVEGIRQDAIKEKMSDMDVFVAWHMGLSTYKACRKMGCKFPHD